MAAPETLSHAAPAFNGRAPRHEVALAEARTLVIERAAAAWRGGARCPLSRWPQLPALPVLAEGVRADRPWPPFRRAMRDGYALRMTDVAAPLRLCGEVLAGAASAPPCPPGGCLAIMTGAAVPEELDTVVMVENTCREGALVTVRGGARRGENIAAAGSDSPSGAIVAAAGRRLAPAAVAALASAGVADALVMRPPRTAILATGDELVPATASPRPSQIRNSNGPMLAAQCRRYGADVVCEQLLPDDTSKLELALDEAHHAAASLIVFSGGASVGSADLVAALLARRGIELQFDAVRTRPGRPVLFGERDGRLYFGLPGNPLGALLACALLVRPALELLGGLDATAVTTATLAARLGFDYSGKPLNLESFLPVKLVAHGLSAEVHPLTYHGSADLAAAAAADAFVHVPAGATHLPAGTWVGIVQP
ncbi:MAG: molybdopterin molybdotransferase MoeA [Terriglobales bacterium]